MKESFAIGTSDGYSNAVTQNTSDAVSSLLFFCNVKKVIPAPLACDDNVSKIGNVFEYGLNDSNGFVGDDSQNEISTETQSTGTGLSQKFSCVNILNNLEKESGLQLDDDERLLFQSNEGINKASTDARKSAIETRMVNTVLKFGGNSLGFLFETKVPSDYSDGTVDDYVFYNIIGGKKDVAKHKVLDIVLKLCALKWSKFLYFVLFYFLLIFLTFFFQKIVVLKNQCHLMN